MMWTIWEASGLLLAYKYCVQQGERTLGMGDAQQQQTVILFLGRVYSSIQHQAGRSGQEEGESGLKAA